MIGNLAHIARFCLGNMAATADHFMYFAFGSNLLKERLQLANPSAIFHCTGRLKQNYTLNFGLWGEHIDNHWHGGVATIQQKEGGEVWGVVWRMSNDHLASLDKQEGVDMGMYFPLEVTVETDNGALLCRTYQMNRFHACPPSPQYKQVVCLGAQQNGLPVQYMRRLEEVQTNNYSGPSILDKISQVIK
ncbi:gamma-glutamylcyclotransferase a isoform X1 [Oncorhynchus mykiss]|nr:gamma-glutamylcyclotransferase a isoform X1 [Oncorhynchus mykiss]